MRDLLLPPNAGLRAADTPVTLHSFRAFARVNIDPTNPAYRVPLERSAGALLAAVGSDRDVVLRGSIGSGKYVDVLLPILGARLMFPVHFVWRVDMSRGGLMLRCAAAGVELDYVPLDGAARHGQRPPKLEPIRATRAAPPSRAAKTGSR